MDSMVAQDAGIFASSFHGSALAEVEVCSWPPTVEARRPNAED